MYCTQAKLIMYLRNRKKYEIAVTPKQVQQQNFKSDLELLWMPTSLTLPFPLILDRQQWFRKPDLHKELFQSIRNLKECWFRKKKISELFRYSTATYQLYLNLNWVSRNVCLPGFQVQVITYVYFVLWCTMQLKFLGFSGGTVQKKLAIDNLYTHFNPARILLSLPLEWFLWTSEVFNYFFSKGCGKKWWILSGNQGQEA